MSSTIINNAAKFIWNNARLLERVLFAHLFEGGPRDIVAAAVAAYRNDDGGFGHALEPDVRAPSSQPLFCEIALRALHAASIRDSTLASGVAEFLASIAEPIGRVAIVMPEVLKYPRAVHWTNPEFSGDSPNPTAALVGMLRYQRVEHRWLERAAAWCWRRVEQPIDEAHEIVCALTFLEHEPDRERASAVAIKLAKSADLAKWFLRDPGSEQYGLTPLHLCPRPDSIARPAFADALINAHLDDLARRQQPDGGWPISWTAPSPASEMEWRGIWTLDALVRLRAYGRI